ncbi:hypothetical protein FPOAC1_007492 [Fusarium poae]|uniref:hypothetical protein n=1 Tax=Fusarium poae TaxID=36050 RepID=UPI001CE9D81F|nr:hypothetical protein FPOAC1_007492 [Fusarium poae]KAG8668124.1 hypothetical protein FPOAC1_007492 [Fusarium poae]
MTSKIRFDLIAGTGMKLSQQLGCIAVQARHGRDRCRIELFAPRTPFEASDSDSFFQIATDIARLDREAPRNRQRCNSTPRENTQQYKVQRQHDIREASSEIAPRDACPDTAKDDLAHIRHLIKTSYEAKFSDQELGIPHDIIDDQLKLLNGLSRVIQDADEPVVESCNKKEEEESKMGKIINRMNTIANGIKWSQEMMSNVEAELVDISLLVDFARIGGRGVKALENKHPGLLKDLRDMARELENHSFPSQPAGPASMGKGT